MSWNRLLPDLLHGSVRDGGTAEPGHGEQRKPQWPEYVHGQRNVAPACLNEREAR